VLAEQGEGAAEEGGELRRAHLARGNGELPVPHTAEPAGVAGDGHVVGRIGEHHLRQLAGEQGVEAGQIEGVAAEQAVVVPEQPEVASARHRRPGRRFGQRRLLLGLRVGADHEVDLGHAEAGQLHLEAEVHQLRELERQRLAVPAGKLGQAVVGDDTRGAGRG
jgi:hypothetical protein